MSGYDTQAVELHRMLRAVGEQKTQELSRNTLDLFRLFQTDPACWQFFESYRTGCFPSFEAMLAALVLYLHKEYAHVFDLLLKAQQNAAPNLIVTTDKDGNTRVEERP